MPKADTAMISSTNGRLRIVVRRFGAFVLAGGLTYGAVMMFGAVAVADGFDWLDVVRLALVALSAFWLAWGACTALLGLLFGAEQVARIEGLPAGRTAVLIPVYNEATGPVFARLETMYRSLDRLGVLPLFEFHVLSDSTRAECAEQEKAAHRRLLLRLGAGGRLFYRHRSPNTGRKAGNIADFLRTSGGAYDYMLVLDADSLMRGETILEMVRRMEAEPGLGLLQTVPQIIGRRTLFGRMLQFSASFYSPIFSRGVAALQGGEGPFWGHNALVRVRAFASSCGMPKLKGKPPFGGDILSHDTVEAAMLAREGWQVRLDPDLTGSYEEAPANLIEYAKRDRRWCQGNLQHLRLVGAPRFKLWSRISILQGVFAYLGSPIWLLFLVASVVAPVFAPPPVYFNGQSPFPVFPHPETEKALALLFGVVALLIAPKILLVSRAVFSGGTRGFGGAMQVVASAVFELVLTSVLAPIHMMFQSRSVLQVVSGADFGWPATDREDGSLSLRESLSATWWMSLFGAGVLWLAIAWAPGLVAWLLPVVLPLVAAPVLVWGTASVGMGGVFRSLRLFLTPCEAEPEPVLRVYQAIALHAEKEQTDAMSPASPKAA
ncbi:glucans biosynthesis glucosyltransferase MdoH [Stappia albiluteola]|nr:glucans biosynthesis glucosyltransferase MdoH [Stappia albiluteola]